MRVLASKHATHHIRTATAIALTLALASGAVPAAWGDPPLGHEGVVVSRAATVTASNALCGDVCSGQGYGSVGVPTRSSASAAPRSAASPDGSFDWGDAGIGAGSMLAMTIIGVGGVLAATRRLGRRTPDKRATAHS
jgi:hypothetical protein